MITLDPEQIAEDFVRLALAIDQHRTGYIDSYFGPPELQSQVVEGGPYPVHNIYQSARDLLDTLEHSSVLDDCRHRYLQTEVQAMVTIAGLLVGDALSLAKESEGVFDVSPSWVDESAFLEARQELDDLLPPGQTLNERMVARGNALIIANDKVPFLCDFILGEIRQRTRQLFSLPDTESVSLETPNVDEPWGGYHRYHGNFHSHVQINTNLPRQILDLLFMLSHETYPGHHTEAVLKEKHLLRGSGRLEHSLIMSTAPSCVIQEGIAMQAIHTLMDTDALADWCQQEIFPRAGLVELDAARELQIARARWKLEEVFGNAAFLIHDQGASREVVLTYFNQYVPEMPENLSAMVDFIETPHLRAYIFAYTYGFWLLQKLFEERGDQLSWFSRLLREPWTPSMLKEDLSPET